ncbi:Tad domain-containing protein [Mesorhizobium sp. CO1-1-7]|nr:Tad domain-containing protein [Mesorhizobium sp. CO1-1-7]
MLGLAIPAILAAVGFAVDVTSLMRAKVNLQNSLDGAILASSHLRTVRQTAERAATLLRSQHRKSHRALESKRHLRRRQGPQLRKN